MPGRTRWYWAVIAVTVAMAAVTPTVATAAQAGTTAPLTVSGDPYSTGCDGGTFNSPKGDLVGSTTFTLSTGVVIHVENWFSPRCVTNWARAWWSGTVTQSDIEIFTQGHINDSPGTHHQCFPTSCTGLYTGGLSPTWTDMIEGTDVACVYSFQADSRGNGFGFGADGNGLCR